mgnify:CR=1 FL=1
MRIVIVLLSFVLNNTLYAQTSIPADFELIRLSNGEIRLNDTINEHLIDLVSVSVHDSIITKKKQHHRLFLVGWAIHAFGGYNWRAIDLKKQKIVGTVERSSRSNEEQFSEHDVNFDVYFNTQKYLQTAFRGYDRSAEIKRQDIRRGKHLKNYTIAPYKRDSATLDKFLYRIHAELTPPDAFRQQLNLLFYPVYHNQSLATHPNIEDPKPSIGFYGLYCTDCNHSCSPELHPYEWIWWLKTTDSLSADKQWFAGLFHESSNRFPDWSTSPKIGTIAIPFSFDITKSAIIDLQPLCVGELIENGAFSFVPLGEYSFTLNFSEKQINIPFGKQGYNITLRNATPLQSNGLQCWIETLGYNPKNKTINGYIHLSIATRSLFTFNAKMSEQ